MTGTAVGEPITTHRGPATQLCALTTPDGRATLGAGGADGTVRIIDAEVINTLIAPAS